MACIHLPENRKESSTWGGMDIQIGRNDDPEKRFAPTPVSSH